MRSSILSAALIGSSVGSLFAAVLLACVASAASASLVRFSIMKASAPAPAPSARNGNIGMPGNSDMTIITAADMPSAFG